ncbi:hypothetical protein ATB99_00865 [Elizabethkingia meningoseptica]|nr:hypothetical protein ATB99_00865 [Elizabethkingia meningoseptica]
MFFSFHIFLAFGVSNIGVKIKINIFLLNIVYFFIGYVFNFIYLFGTVGAFIGGVLLIKYVSKIYALVFIFFLFIFYEKHGLIQ